MTPLRTLSFIAGLTLAAAPAFAEPATYDVDPAHSEVAFAVKHAMVSTVRGTVSGVHGTVIYDPKDPSKTVIDVTATTSTIDTHEPKRDAHLRSPDFFDTDKIPTATFKSKKVVAKGAGHLAVTGDLTMHGVTNEVTFDVEGPSAEAKDPWGNVKIGATATATINRKNWGLTWNKALETGGLLVSEDVKLTVDLELGKKAPAKTASAK